MLISDQARWRAHPLKLSQDLRPVSGLYKCAVAGHLTNLMPTYETCLSPHQILLPFLMSLPQFHPVSSCPLSRLSWDRMQYYHKLIKKGKKKLDEIVEDSLK